MKSTAEMSGMLGSHPYFVDTQKSQSGDSTSAHSRSTPGYKHASHACFFWQKSALGSKFILIIY